MLSGNRTTRENGWNPDVSPAYARTFEKSEITVEPA